ncbi:MAG: tyrosine-protein phosphatase [Planctomycetota bacterium]
MMFICAAILFGCGTVPPAPVPATPAPEAEAAPLADQSVVTVIAPEQPAVEAPVEAVAAPVEPTLPAAAARDPRWAQPMTKPGLPNLHKVSDVLFRGAQPTAEGFKELKAMGIRTVVNLRSFHSDRDMLGDLGLTYEHIYMKAWHAEDEDIIRFLKIINDPARQPVFVHCQHGADRTGTVCAIYRIVLQGWTQDEAIREMTGGDFGFHEIWDNLPEYISNLDLAKIRKQAGITKP